MRLCWSASTRLSELSRLKDLLADARGSVKARFAFSRLEAGRVGATVAVQATPRLVCQRCLQDFDLPVSGDSEIEFAMSEAEAPAESPREIYLMDEGSVSLRELAEEELLLALPAIASCSTPETCGRAPAAGRAAKAVCGIAGFIEENLIGQTTHGSSKK